MLESWILSSDEVDGALVEIGERPRKVLLTGALPEKIPGRNLHTGSITVRYGLAFLYERDGFFVERIIDDFGRAFEGQQALDFAARRGDAFPRATVVGVRASTGEPTEVFLKQLDLARDAIPVAYRDKADGAPIGFVEAVVWIDASAGGWERMDPIEQPPLSVTLMSAVPCFRVPPAQVPNLPALLASTSP